MNRWKLITGLVLIFILGTLAGSVGTGFYFKRQYPRLLSHEARRAFFMRKLSKELNLTPDQNVKIGQIVEQIEELRREYARQKQAEIDKLISQMKTELNDDQQKRLDLLRERFKRRKAREQR